MTQTWWLSFCDPDKPAGQQFLGVVIIDVDETDAQRAEGTANAIRATHHLPPLTEPDDRMMAAAIWKSHRLKVNPGGEVASVRLDTHPEVCDPRRPLPPRRAPVAGRHRRDRRRDH